MLACGCFPWWRKLIQCDMRSDGVNKHSLPLQSIAAPAIDVWRTER